MRLPEAARLHTDIAPVPENSMILIVVLLALPFHRLLHLLHPLQLRRLLCGAIVHYLCGRRVTGLCDPRWSRPRNCNCSFRAYGLWACRLFPELEAAFSLPQSSRL